MLHYMYTTVCTSLKINFVYNLHIKVSPFIFIFQCYNLYFCSVKQVTNTTYIMINSNCKLYRNIVNLSLNNVSTTIGENLRYFMYKYMIQEYDWYESINIIYKKIDSYMLSHFNAKVQCDAAVIRELCESRDSCSDLLFSRKELKVFIEMLCIK